MKGLIKILTIVLVNILISNICFSQNKNKLTLCRIDKDKSIRVHRLDYIKLVTLANDTIIGSFYKLRDTIIILRHERTHVAFEFTANDIEYDSVAIKNINFVIFSRGRGRGGEFEGWMALFTLIITPFDDFNHDKHNNWSDIGIGLSITAGILAVGIADRKICDAINKNENHQIHNYKICNHD